MAFIERVETIRLLAAFGALLLFCGGLARMGFRMPIYRLLRDSAFEPDPIAVMAAAFEDVCRDFRLAERNDSLRDIVAKAIIECAQTGGRDAIRCGTAPVKP